MTEYDNTLSRQATSNKTTLEVGGGIVVLRTLNRVSEPASQVQAMFEEACGRLGRFLKTHLDEGFVVADAAEIFSIVHPRSRAHAAHSSSIKEFAAVPAKSNR